MLRVFKASGEKVFAMQAEELTTPRSMLDHPIRVLDLKRRLQPVCGHPRFRQRLLLLPDGQILPDDAALNGPMDVQLILQPFSKSSREEVLQLCDAATLADLPALEQFLQRPQDPNLVREGDSISPLMCACFGGHVEVVRLLLDARANMDWTDVDNATPIFLASQENRVEVVRLLLEAKADKDRADLCGQAPIHVASKRGHVQVVRLLLEAKADKDSATGFGATPMSMAWEKGHAEVAQLLAVASR